MFLASLPITIISGVNGLSDGFAVSGRRLMVDGLPYSMRGVGYSPTPIGVEPEVTPPYGDYYTSDFSSIYMRDLPLLRQMGTNTIRLWGWNNNADHSDFLNKAYNNGVNPIRVIVTFWMDPSYYPDISSQASRTQIISAFRNMVALNKNNPAVLMWSIGNEANAPWQYGNHLDDLFSLINEMAQAAHTEEGTNAHPITTPLADVNLLSTISKYDKTMTNLDVWSVQVYRGSSFGSLFTDYESLSSKPLAITEYGIDAYDNKNHDEYEKIGSPFQATYAQSLWSEIASNSDICVGGSIIVFSDEWWKGKYGSTPDNNPSYHSESGYATTAHPDGFSNEEWWGIMRTVDNGFYPDIMQPRAAYYALQKLWVSNSPTPTPTITPTLVPTPTPSPSLSPSPTSKPTTTPTPTPSSSPTHSPSSTPSPSPTPTSLPSLSPNPPPSSTPTNSPTASPSPSPSPTPTTTTPPTSTSTTSPTHIPTPNLTSNHTVPPETISPSPSQILSPSSSNISPFESTPLYLFVVVIVIILAISATIMITSKNRR